MRITSGLLTSAIIAVPFILFIAKRYKKSEKKDRIKVLFLILLFIYTVYLFKYAVFPIYVSGSMKESMQRNRELHLFEKLNFIPFFKCFYRKDFVLNMIMTAPLGFLIPCMKKNAKNGIFFLGILTGFLIV